MCSLLICYVNFCIIATITAANSAGTATGILVPALLSLSLDFCFPSLVLRFQLKELTSANAGNVLSDGFCLLSVFFSVGLLEACRRVSVPPAPSVPFGGVFNSDCGN